MERATITLPPGQEIEVSFPDNLTTAVINSMIAEIARRATAIMAKSGSKIVTVSVMNYAETEAKIVFYGAKNKVLSEEVLPFVAKAQAYQDGRIIPDKMGLDNDILEQSNRKRERRRLAGDSTTDAPPPKK